MIELYGMSSPNVAKVTILLEELELPYETRHVDVFRGPGRIGAIAAHSPFGKVPVIIDRRAGDLAVFESGAILTYLAERYGGEALLPPSGPDRYAVLQWLTAQVATVGPFLGQNNHFRLLPDEAGSYAARRYAEQSRHVFHVLDKRLAAAAYLAGDFYSIADIATYPWAGYVPRQGLDWGDFPALKAWCDRIGERPAVVRAAKVQAAFGPQDMAARQGASQEDLDRFFWRDRPGPAADFDIYANPAPPADAR